VLDGVINSHAGGYRATRAVDIESDVLFRVFAFQQEQLSDHQVGYGVVNWHTQKYDALAQKTREDVESSFAARRRFDDGRWVVSLGSHAPDIVYVLHRRTFVIEHGEFCLSPTGLLDIRF
jgi:hypothetical protein